MNKIKPESFISAFSKVWTNQDHGKVIQNYKDNKKWTEFMLHEGGFIEQIMNNLHSKDRLMTYCREYYTVDALFVGGEDLYREGKLYPEKVYALIEHENASDVETEMWKLIHWRCPLKALIFYDYSDVEKLNNENKNKWVQSKLNYLFDMLVKVNNYYPENLKTEYLFIIGGRKSGNELPYWRWTTNTIKNLIEL